MVTWASLQFVIEAVPDHTTSCYIFTSRLNIQADWFSGKNSLVVGIHIHLIQNAQLSSGVENCFV